MVQQAAVIKLPIKARRRAKVTTKVSTKPTTKPQATRRSATQRYQGIGYYAVGGTLLTLSLDHLATGIASVMHLPMWQASIMALAVDVGFVMTECMPFSCDKATLDDTRWVRHGFAAAMFLGSGTFNTLSIGTGWQATLAGFAIPAVIATCLHLANRCILGRSK